jgi:hypothetical protein
MADIKISALTSAAAVGTSVVPVSNAAGTATNKVTLADIAALANDTRWNLFLPAAPTSVAASAGNAQATVSWTAPTGTISQAPITDYVVQFSSDSGSSWTTFGDSTSTTASAVVTGLTNGTAYVFRVAAVNAIGQGAWSSASNSISPMDNPITANSSSLYAWYDASASNSAYDAATGGSVVTSDGANVQRLADMSGNGRHIRNYFGGSTCVSLAAGSKNGKNTVLFNNTAGGQALQTADWIQNGSFRVDNPLTIFMVWKPMSNWQLPIYPVSFSWGDTASWLAVYVGLAEDRAQMRTYDATWVGTGTSRPGNWLCQRAVMNGTSSKMFVNGVYDAPTTYQNGTSTDPAAMNFSKPCGDIRFNGYFYLAEVLFFSGALSDSTCASIDTFLMTKWGIT